MLSYQHGYHAGNFADVIKHSALCCLLSYLTQKERPLFYFETHAGKGFYDLKDKQAEKTGEYKQGIKPVWADKAKLPPVFQEYLNIISKLNKTEHLHYYPGSPYIAINALRPSDRAYLCELHPAEYDVLAQMPRFNKKVHCSNTDGIAAMKALLPPAEKRALIFIDPSYEIKDEYKTIPAALKQIYSRFPTGVYCLWYPIINKRITDQFIRRMKDIGANNALRVEFNLKAIPKEGMSGCGLWIINPPYTFAEEIKSILNTLKSYFNPTESSYIIEPETSK